MGVISAGKIFFCASTPKQAAKIRPAAAARLLGRGGLSFLRLLSIS